MGKLLAAAVTAAVALSVGLGGLVAVVSAPVESGAHGPDGAAGAAPELPAAWVTLYGQAASTCPGLPWSVLAACP
jgi:hypothetical protein